MQWGIASAHRHIEFETRGQGVPSSLDVDVPRAFAKDSLEKDVQAKCAKNKRLVRKECTNKGANEIVFFFVGLTLSPAEIPEQQNSNVKAAGGGEEVGCH